MVTVQNSGYCGDFFWEKAQVEFGVALLYHAPQKSWGVDAALWFVHGAAIAAHAFLMATVAVVLGDELCAQFQIGIFEEDRLSHGNVTQKKAGQCECLKVHVNLCS